MLRDLAALGPFFAVSSHLPDASPVAPWRPANELASPGGPLRERIAAARARLAARRSRAAGEIDPRVAASAVHLGLVARLTAPAIGAAVLRCPVDMSLSGLWWREQTDPVPLSVPVPAVSRGEAPSPAAHAGWEQQFLDEVITPVTMAIAVHTPVSGRVLWGNVASAVNSAAVQLAAGRPDLAPDAWLAAARLLASPQLNRERNPPGPAFRRASCCLFYRLAPGAPGAICGDCILRDRYAHEACP
jgi:hypothetical protein